MTDAAIEGGCSPSRRRVYCISPACKTPFASLHLLKRHLAVHFEIESKCEYCGKVFAYRRAGSSVVRHWMTACTKVPQDKKDKCIEKRCV